MREIYLKDLSPVDLPLWYLGKPDENIKNEDQRAEEFYSRANILNNIGVELKSLSSESELRAYTRLLLEAQTDTNTPPILAIRNKVNYYDTFGGKVFDKIEPNSDACDIRLRQIAESNRRKESEIFTNANGHEISIDAGTLRLYTSVEVASKLLPEVISSPFIDSVEHMNLSSQPQEPRMLELALKDLGIEIDEQTRKSLTPVTFYN